MLHWRDFEQSCSHREAFSIRIFSLIFSFNSLKEIDVFAALKLSLRPKRRLRRTPSATHLIILIGGNQTMPSISRRALAAVIAISALMPGAATAADALKEIHIDWATYNPVSMILKQKGLLEKEFAKDGINIVWVQSAGSNKALEFLNAGSIDFGSTAGSAALVAKINGNPIKSIYVYSRPEWTALVTTKDSKITSVADLKGKRVAVTRGTDPHIFLVRALLDAGLSEKDITPVLLQHADGKTALIRGDVDAWAGLDPMMAQAEVEDGAKLFFRNPAANTWGILNVREQFLKDHPDVVRRVLAVYEDARKYSLANYDDLKKTFIGVTKLPDAVVDKQLKERTELTYSRIGAPQRESILAAGLALQQAGVIDAKVDVKATLNDLIDDQVPLPTN
jgi:sulfonate transport system substrate-binding protein